jgi:hypothetical protein
LSCAMKPSTFRYRLCLWIYRNLRVRDFVQLLMAATAGWLRVAGAGGKPAPPLVNNLFYLYFALLAVHIALTLWQRRARDRVQGAVMWGLFDRINREIFKGDHRTRFTLFRRAPLVWPGEIIPWFRYHQGGHDAIALAARSRAHFRRGEGITGGAWDQGQTIFCAPLPQFQSREQFEHHYVNTLEVRKPVVTGLSPFMEKVQTIFAYGFLDQQGHFLGVLSLDFKGVLTLEDGGVTVESAPNQAAGGSTTPLKLNAREMELMLKDVESVLTSFAQAEGEGVAR